MSGVNNVSQVSQAESGKMSKLEKIGCFAVGAALITSTIWAPGAKNFIKNFGKVKPGQQLPFGKYVKLSEDVKTLKMGTSRYSVEDLEFYAKENLNIGESMVYGRENLVRAFETNLDPCISSRHLQILRSGENKFRYMDISSKLK